MVSFILEMFEKEQKSFSSIVSYQAKVLFWSTFLPIVFVFFNN